MNRRVYLRALEPDDYKISILWRNDSQIWDMLGGMRRYVSKEYEKAWVEKAIFDTENIRWAVCCTEDNRYIGNVYMTDIDRINRSCQSHILIGDKNYWGNGYGREALSEAIEYMFQEENINRITAIVLETNSASLKMHEKLGYKIEGLMRNSVYKNGQYKNQYILSLLKQEYESR